MLHSIEVKLSGAYLENANIYQASDEKGDIWLTHLTNVNFREAFVRHFGFLFAQGNRTDFTDAILDGSNLRYVHLNESLFYNTSINNVSLSSTSIVYSN
jgi:uncharacterized protein YjbI with pentapeptide repeats